jgi:hypothetical protein
MLFLFCEIETHFLFLILCLIKTTLFFMLCANAN